MRNIPILILSSFSSLFSLNAAAQLSDEDRAKLITDSVHTLCRTPSEQGRAFDIEISGTGGAIAGLRNLPRAAGHVSAEFSRSEWDGVQRVLQDHQLADNEGYRECVKQLTPLFLDKFLPQSGPRSSNAIGTSTPKLADDFASRRINWNTTLNDLDLCNRLGQSFMISCPPSGSINSCAGGGSFYSCTSRICSAAVHAGAISAVDGGTFQITIEGVSGMKQAASVSNGVSCGYLSANWQAFRIH